MLLNDRCACVLRRRFGEDDYAALVRGSLQDAAAKGSPSLQRRINDARHRLDGFLTVNTLGAVQVTSREATRALAQHEQQEAVMAHFMKSFGCTVPSVNPAQRHPVQVFPKGGWWGELRAVMTEFHIRAVLAVLLRSPKVLPALDNLDDLQVDSTLREWLDNVRSDSVFWCLLEAVCKSAFSQVMITAHGPHGRLRGLNPKEVSVA